MSKVKDFFSWKKPPDVQWDTKNETLDELANRITSPIGDSFLQMDEILQELATQTDAIQPGKIDLKDEILIDVGKVPPPKDIFWRGESDYCHGGDGCIQWAIDNLRVSPDGKSWIPIGSPPTEKNPDTGRSWQDVWTFEQAILRQCLEMINGEFKYDTIVFCWPRGEAKSFLTCLIQLWKFFCFSKQQIALGATSKEQSKFVHFEIIKEFIIRSPSLLEQIGPKNLQEKEIRFRKHTTHGSKTSVLWPIPAASGIVSNITGFTFSELFLMTDPRFYQKLDSSRRNMVNALGIIDSTVSVKGHILHKLYKAWLNDQNKKLYFSHRFSVNADYEDYKHPNMTQDQLNNFKSKFDEQEFAMLFKNTWDAGNTRLFSPQMITALDVTHIDGKILDQANISLAMDHKIELEKSLEEARSKGLETSEHVQQIMAINQRCKYLSEILHVGVGYTLSFDRMKQLGQLFDTHWAILVGIDFGDPLAKKAQARTIITVILKGLPNSMRIYDSEYSIEEAAPKYIYLLAEIHNIESHSTIAATRILADIDDRLDGIDSIGQERYQGETVANWVGANAFNKDIHLEIVSPNYNRSKESFTSLYQTIKEGRLKAPVVHMRGSKSDDIIREELNYFSHDVKNKSYSSPEKFEKRGVRDDAVYALNWALYSGRTLGIERLRIRMKYDSTSLFGSCYQDKSYVDYDDNLVGDYGKNKSDYGDGFAKVKGVAF